jgi:hypothetical protein
MDPPMSISLTDAQTDAITNLARPLAPTERAGFFAELFETLLMRRDEVGDGELGRLLRDLHCRYFRPPPDDEAGLSRRVSRWQHKLTQPRSHPRLRRATARNESGT